MNTEKTKKVKAKINGRNFKIQDKENNLTKEINLTTTYGENVQVKLQYILGKHV